MKYDVRFVYPSGWERKTFIRVEAESEQQACVLAAERDIGHRMREEQVYALVAPVFDDAFDPHVCLRLVAARDTTSVVGQMVELERPKKLKVFANNGSLGWEWLSAGLMVTYGRPE